MNRPDVEEIVDLARLRGWHEHRDEELARHHPLPPLGHLIHSPDDGPPRNIPFFGPDLILGRFQAQFTPVDLPLPHLADHERYKLNAPHLRLRLTDRGWTAQALSPVHPSAINDESLPQLRTDYPLLDGDTLTLGVARFTFRSSLTSSQALDPSRELTILDQANAPALFLLRAGAPAGPYRVLPRSQPLLIGRTYPDEHALPEARHWPPPCESFWDLSGLPDHERHHIAFRHAQITFHNDHWHLEALSARQRVFLNRSTFSGRIKLEAGDEIALGTVLFRFHSPRSVPPLARPPFQIPEIIDWSAGE